MDWILKSCKAATIFFVYEKETSASYTGKWGAPSLFCLLSVEVRRPIRRCFTPYHPSAILILEWLIEHSFNTNRTGGHHSRSAQYFKQRLLESWAERFLFAAAERSVAPSAENIT